MAARWTAARPYLSSRLVGSRDAAGVMLEVRGVRRCFCDATHILRARRPAGRGAEGGAAAGRGAAGVAAGGGARGCALSSPCMPPCPAPPCLLPSCNINKEMLLHQMQLLGWKNKGRVRRACKAGGGRCQMGRRVDVISQLSLPSHSGRPLKISGRCNCGGVLSGLPACGRRQHTWRDERRRAVVDGERGLAAAQGRQRLIFKPEVLQHAGPA